MATSSAIIYRLIARDSASRTFAQVGRNAQRLDSTSSKVAAGLKKTFAVGALAVGAIGVAAIKVAGDFEKNMNRVEALSGATGKNLKLLRDQAKDFGNTTQYSATQSADAMAQLATAGLNVKQIYGSMPSVLALASSEQLDLTRAAEISTSVMTGYGMTVKQMPAAIDAMVKASVKANTSVDDLGEAFKYAGPIAHQAGLRFTETVASMALMGNAGIKASMAGTALRGAVTRLLSPTDKIQGVLDKLGVKVSTASGKLLPLNDIVHDLGKKGATTGDIMTIFGQRAGPGMAALIQQGSDKLVQLTKELDNSGGTADRISKIQMKGWRGEVIRLKNAWQGLMIEIGDTGLLSGATRALTGVTRATRGFAAFVNAKGIPAAKSLGHTLGSIVPVGKIKRGFGDAKSAVTDFFAGLSGKGTKDLAIPRVDAAPQVVPKSSSAALGTQMRDAVSGGIAGIDWSKLGSHLGKGLATAIGYVGKHTADFTKKIAGVFAKLDFVQIGKSFGSAAIPLAIGFMVNLFQPLFSLEFWKKHWLDTIIAVLSVIPIGRLAGALGKVFSHIPFLRVFTPLTRGISKLGGLLEKGIGKIFKPIGRGIKEGFTRVFPAAAAVLEREAGLIGTRLGSWGLSLMSKGRAAAQSIGRGLQRGTAFVVEKALSLVKSLLKPFARPGGWLLSKGKAIVSGLRTGVVTGAKAIGTWVYGRVVAPILGRFTGSGGWLLSRGRAIVSGLKAGVIGGARAIGSFATTRVIRPLTGAFRSSGSLLVSKGKALLSGLKSGIVAGMKGMGGWLKKSVVDPVVSAVKHFFGIHSPSRVFMGIGGHLVSGLMKGMATTSGTAIAKKVFGDMPSALGALVKKGLVSVENLPAKAMKALGGLGSKLGGFFSGLFGGGGGGGGAGQWSGMVATVLSMLGAPASALGPVLKRINMESGGNPKAINLWDSNAKAGHPSQGLMQTIPGTFAAYAGPFRSRGITDPLANIYAGVNYAMHRYGSNWINVMTRPGGYAKGGYAQFGETAWVGERGAELMQVTKQGTRIFNHADSVKIAKAGGIKLPGYASGTITNAGVRVEKAKDRVEEAKDRLADAKRRHKGVKAAETELKAAQTALRAAQQQLANARRSAKSSIGTTLANGFLKKLETGTASAINSAIKGITTKLLNAGYNKLAKSVLKSGDKLAALADKRADVTKKIAAANAYVTDQADGIKDALSITGTSAGSASDLIKQMGDQQKTQKDFLKLVTGLRKRGLSSDILAQLAEAGPGSQLAGILGDRGLTASDISKMNKLAKSGSELATTFGKTMADAMYDSGKDAGKGFLTGLKSQEKALQKQIDKLAKSLISSIKKALKIKSPSGVFRDEVGKQVVLGWVAGMDDHGHLVGASAQRLADTAAGVSTRRRYVPAVRGAQPAGDHEELFARLAMALEASGSDVHVHFNDDRLRDLIDVQVKPKIKASESAQAYRAKTGRR
jgi:TP901 family phage tail tape measure protein